MAARHRLPMTAPAVPPRSRARWWSPFPPPRSPPVPPRQLPSPYFDGLPGGISGIGVHLHYEYSPTDQSYRRRRPNGVRRIGVDQFLNLVERPAGGLEQLDGGSPLSREPPISSMISVVELASMATEPSKNTTTADDDGPSRRCRRAPVWSPTQLPTTAARARGRPRYRPGPPGRRRERGCPTLAGGNQGDGQQRRRKCQEGTKSGDTSCCVWTDASTSGTGGATAGSEKGSENFPSLPARLPVGG